MNVGPSQNARVLIDASRSAKAGSQFATLRTPISFDETNRYWRDPEYRARVDAEGDHARKLANDRMDAALEATGNRWPAHWTETEKQAASRRWNEGE